MSYPAAEPVAGRGPWRQSAYGSYPANGVARRSDPANATKVLTQASNADSHSLFVPPTQRLRAALAGPAAVIQFRFRHRVRQAAQVSLYHQRGHLPEPKLAHSFCWGFFSIFGSSPNQLL